MECALGLASASGRPSGLSAANSAAAVPASTIPTGSGGGSIVVVGIALATNTLVAVFLGGAIPLMLTKLRVDPATAAAPIVTTIIDACGFFLVLSIADAARAYLT